MILALSAETGVDIQAEDKRMVIKQKLRRYFDGKIVRKGIWYIVKLEYDSNFDYDSGIVSADGAHLRSKKENQNDSPIKIIMKDYMASGSFARGKEELIGCIMLDCSWKTGS